MERLPLKYKRRVEPSSVLPPDLIQGFYEKNPQAIKEVEKWLDKNGLTILFTLEEAYGDEKVWLDPDGQIYIGRNKHYPFFWLKARLLRLSPDLLNKAIQEKWRGNRIFEEIKKRC